MDKFKRIHQNNHTKKLKQGFKKTSRCFGETIINGGAKRKPLRMDAKTV